MFRPATSARISPNLSAGGFAFRAGATVPGGIVSKSARPAARSTANQGTPKGLRRSRSTEPPGRNASARFGLSRLAGTCIQATARPAGKRCRFRPCGPLPNPGVTGRPGGRRDHPISAFFNPKWCPRRESNSQALRRRILNPLRLPFRHSGPERGLSRTPAPVNHMRSGRRWGPSQDRRSTPGQPHRLLYKHPARRPARPKRSKPARPISRHSSSPRASCICRQRRWPRAGSQGSSMSPTICGRDRWRNGSALRRTGRWRVSAPLSQR